MADNRSPLPTQEMKERKTPSFGEKQIGTTALALDKSKIAGTLEGIKEELRGIGYTLTMGVQSPLLMIAANVESMTKEFLGRAEELKTKDITGSLKDGKTTDDDDKGKGLGAKLQEFAKSITNSIKGLIPKGSTLGLLGLLGAGLAAAFKPQWFIDNIIKPITDLINGTAETWLGKLRLLMEKAFEWVEEKLGDAGLWTLAILGTLAILNPFKTGSIMFKALAGITKFGAKLAALAFKQAVTGISNLMNAIGGTTKAGATGLIGKLKAFGTSVGNLAKLGWQKIVDGITNFSNSIGKSASKGAKGLGLLGRLSLFGGGIALAIIALDQFGDAANRLKEKLLKDYDEIMKKLGDLQNQAPSADRSQEAANLAGEAAGTAERAVNQGKSEKQRRAAGNVFEAAADLIQFQDLEDINDLNKRFKSRILGAIASTRSFETIEERATALTASIGDITQEIQKSKFFIDANEEKRKKILQGISKVAADNIDRFKKIAQDDGINKDLQYSRSGMELQNTLIGLQYGKIEPGLKKLIQAQKRIDDLIDEQDDFFQSLQKLTPQSKSQEGNSVSVVKGGDTYDNSNKSKQTIQYNYYNYGNVAGSSPGPSKGLGFSDWLPTGN